LLRHCPQEKTPASIPSSVFPCGWSAECGATRHSSYPYY
jgi:hypothetical protein